MAQFISSNDNPNIKTLSALLAQSGRRQKLGQTVLDGSHLLAAYLAHKMPQQVFVNECIFHDDRTGHQEILALISHLSCPVFTLAEKLYKKITKDSTGAPVLAIINAPNLTLPTTLNGDCLILDCVQDVGNFGTLLRSASASGFDQILCTTGTAKAWSPKALRAGMGAQFNLSIYENLTAADVLDVVKSPLFATSSHTQTVVYHTDLRSPLALVLGNEGAGVSDILLQNAQPIGLPQQNEESLNVAVAGSVCMFEIIRQRKFV